MDISAWIFLYANELENYLLRGVANFDERIHDTLHHISPQVSAVAEGDEQLLLDGGDGPHQRGQGGEHLLIVRVTQT